jgi:hypothetical protein
LHGTCPRRRERLRHHEFPQRNPALSRALVGEVDHAAGKFAEKTVACCSSKEEFVRMAIKQKAQTRIKPGAAEQFEIVECRVVIKGRKHGERLVQFFDASTVVEKEQAVDEGSFASGKQDIVGAPFRLKKTMGWRQEWTWRYDTMVSDGVKDHILAGASREIVDGLKSLVGDPVEFERGMEGNDGVFSESSWHTIAIQRSGGECSRVDSVSYLSDSILVFESVEQIQKGAISFILVI